jgi:hypothetical protein
MGYKVWKLDSGSKIQNPEKNLSWMLSIEPWGLPGALLPWNTKDTYGSLEAHPEDKIHP